MATDVVTADLPRIRSRPSWGAIDREAEEQLDREVTRKVSWRQALMRWLVEYNKY